MGLVQASENDIEGDKQKDVSGVKLIWDSKVEEMTQYYGHIVVDYMKFLSRGHLVARFERVTPC